MDQLKIAQFCYATQKYTKATQEILKQEINVNYSIPDELPKPLQKKACLGYTYLHMTADKHDLSATNELIDRGADFMKQGLEDGCTPLILAVRYSYEDNKEIYGIIGTLVENPVAQSLLSAQLKAGNTFNPKCKNGISHLHVASIMNNVEAIESFLKAGNSVDQAIKDNSSELPGYTPLHCAARYSSVEAFEMLLKHGANVHKKESTGMSTLHILIGCLMNAAYFARRGHGQDSIYAKERTKIETIMALVVQAWIANDAEFIDETGLSVFHVICTMKDKSMVENFVKSNTNINLPVKSDAKLWPGWTPLHFASYFNVDTTKILLQNGASINVKNADGETPLDLCLRIYSPQTVHSILSSTDELRNILLDDKSTKLSDVVLSMRSGKKFERLLKKLSPTNSNVPEDSAILPGYSILHLAVAITSTGREPRPPFADSYDWAAPEAKFASVVRSIEFEQELERRQAQRVDGCLEWNSNVAQKNADGSTPLHLAIRLGARKAAETLLNNCDEDAVDRENLSHLHAACLIGNVDAVKRLLKKNEANIDARLKSSDFYWHATALDPMGLQTKSVSLHVQAESTPLHLAVLFGHRRIAEYLAKRGADVEARDSRELTPIHLASASRSSKALVRRLFAGMGPKLRESVTSIGFGYLHAAACANDVDSIDRLLRSDAAVDVNVRLNIPALDLNETGQLLSKGCEGVTPLHMALTMESVDAVRALIAAGADIHAKSPAASTPLQLALFNVGGRCARHFVDRLKSHERRVGALDDSGLTLLHVACAKFDLEWAEKLLDGGADANARICGDEGYDDPWKGQAPMHVLISEARLGCDSRETLVGMVELLLRHGADSTLEADTNTPLQLAFYASSARPRAATSADGMSSDEDEEDEEDEDSSDDDEGDGEVFDAAEMREDDDEDEDASDDDDDNNSPLGESDLLAIADLLLERQASYEINPTNRDGFSHFHYACASNSVGAIEEFLKHGAADLVNRCVDPFASKYAGFTPLHFAVFYTSGDAVYKLIEAGADVKAEDTLGNTPLHVAMMKGFLDLDMIDTLLSRGANINARNIKGETPFELLLLTNVVTLRVFEFFLNHGCSISSAYTSRFRGIIGMAMKNSEPLDLPRIFERLMKVCEIHWAIHSAVSVLQDGRLSVDDYLGVIEKLMEMGCDIDEEDERGLTPLQIATFYFNCEAVEALLLLGANMNAKSKRFEGQPFEAPEELHVDQEDSIFRSIRTFQSLSLHKWKMELVGLDVNNINARAIDELLDLDELNQKAKKRCPEELKMLNDIKVTSCLTMQDLLLDWKMVVEYPAMSLMQRRIIDEFFENSQSLRKTFPDFAGLLRMQYAKISARMKIFDVAKSAISYLCQVPYPELCSEAILRFFTNDELKTLIDAAYLS